MIKLLSESGTVLDVAWSHFGDSPTTFGEWLDTSDGLYEPGELVLTHQNDLMSEQSLDYIF